MAKQLKPRFRSDDDASVTDVLVDKIFCNSRISGISWARVQRFPYGPSCFTMRYCDSRESLEIVGPGSLHHHHIMGFSPLIGRDIDVEKGERRERARFVSVSIGVNPGGWGRDPRV